MSEVLPVDFKDLNIAELRRTAVEDFAVEIEPKASKASVTAALFEAGVEWPDYVAQHPEVAPVASTPAEPEPVKPNRETDAERPGVVTTPKPVGNESLTVDGQTRVDPVDRFAPAPVQAVVAEVPGQVRTYERPVFDPNDRLLIKMERDNPTFEIRGYKFSDTAPYALMKPADAEYLMNTETGFRQAFPSEVQEFYG